MTDEEAFRARLDEIAARAGFVVKDYDLFFVAFTQKTYANEHKVECNERLEYLGDAILDFLVAEHLYARYPKQQEGVLSKTRAEYVCEDANCAYAKELGLDKALLLGKGEEVQGGREKPSILGDLFEAFLGALYLELGLAPIRAILATVVFPKIMLDEGFFIDYKTRLQEDLQSNAHNGISYKVVSATGPANDRTFTVQVTNDGVLLGSGSGKSKKDAEQAAAKNAYDKGVHQ